MYVSCFWVHVCQLFLGACMSIVSGCMYVNCFWVQDHGEGGSLVGAPIKGQRVLILDDVISAGTAIREVRVVHLQHALLQQLCDRNCSLTLDCMNRQ